MSNWYIIITAQKPLHVIILFFSKVLVAFTWWLLMCFLFEMKFRHRLTEFSTFDDTLQLNFDRNSATCDVLCGIRFKTQSFPIFFLFECWNLSEIYNFETVIFLRCKSIIIFSDKDVITIQCSTVFIEVTVGNFFSYVWL